MTTIVEHQAKGQKLRIAIEGCGHGKLDEIYTSVEMACKVKGWDMSELNFLIICGDFQAVRNPRDLNCMAVPPKYRELNDFYAYYSGSKVAPVLTLVVGGNHEASNYMDELYYGGWLAHNIYYLGAANVVRYGPIRIAGLSGIWKGYDYNKPHYEKLPYNNDDVKSIFHVREYDVRKLLQMRTQVDIGISHDWPRSVEWSGDAEQLFGRKRHLLEDAQNGQLGSIAAKYVLDRLRPAYWFSAHLHVKYATVMEHEKDVAAKKEEQTPTTEQLTKPHEPQAAKKNEEVINVLISDSDKEVPSPQPEVAQPNVRVPLSEAEKKTQLGAWSTFHQKAQKEESEEAARERAERAARRAAEGWTGVRNIPQYEIEETHRRVILGEGSSRKVVEAKKRKIGGQEDGPSDEYDSPPTNAEEIKVDLGDSSDDDVPTDGGDTLPKDGAEDVPASGGDALLESAAKSKANIGGSSNRDLHKAVENGQEVPEELRAQLPASFTKAASPPTEVGANPTLPSAIKNSVTRFLALDKVASNRDFLQLVELEPITESVVVDPFLESIHKFPNGNYALQYDPEWLAITKHFADVSEYQQGPRYTPGQADVIYAGYAGPIAEHLEWVKENIVKTGRLDVPRNFSIVAPVHNPKDPEQDPQQPREYPNPQTAEFCDLLDIQNTRATSDAEIEARIRVGPRPEKPRFDSGGRGGRGGFRGGRGGRGGGHGGGRGRGRGGRGGSNWSSRGGHGRGGGQQTHSTQGYDGIDDEMPPPWVDYNKPGGSTSSRGRRGTKSPSGGPKAMTKGEGGSSTQNEVSWATMPNPAYGSVGFW